MDINDEYTHDKIRELSESSSTKYGDALERWEKYMAKLKELDELNLANDKITIEERKARGGKAKAIIDALRFYLPHGSQFPEEAFQIVRPESLAAELAAEKQWEDQWEAEQIRRRTAFGAEGQRKFRHKPTSITPKKKKRRKK